MHNNQIHDKIHVIESSHKVNNDIYVTNSMKCCTYIEESHKEVEGVVRMRVVSLVSYDAVDMCTPDAVRVLDVRGSTTTTTGRRTKEWRRDTIRTKVCQVGSSGVDIS